MFSFYSAHVFSIIQFLKAATLGSLSTVSLIDRRGNKFIATASFPGLLCISPCLPCDYLSKRDRKERQHLSLSLSLLLVPLFLDLPVNNLLAGDPSQTGNGPCTSIRFLHQLPTGSTMFSWQSQTIHPTSQPHGAKTVDLCAQSQLVKIQLSLRGKAWKHPRQRSPKFFLFYLKLEPISKHKNITCLLHLLVSVHYPVLTMVTLPSFTHDIQRRSVKLFTWHYWKS